jgi:hypothetical protein
MGMESKCDRIEKQHAERGGILQHGQWQLRRVDAYIESHLCDGVASVVPRKVPWARNLVNAMGEGRSRGDMPMDLPKARAK